ncbi:hypothetical protein BOTBODRAFT_551037 [Botryobasidium botryosum FD-172 SS1]|uniref:Nuf2 DHR10-like domain-containing protein n=1 Tax=Botryobasidium botryosum (strain FD-172 SS1) TaxID=930990 RepID=A0A067MTU5_BOTB1|nr:hypothetical protein BOTBODRAFT_551037 [Botryobasidium botryosum FD-172 SS1]
MNANAEIERSSLAANEAKSRALQAKLDHLAILEQDIRSIHELLGNINVEQAKLEEAIRSLEEFRNFMESKTIESRELTTKSEQLDRQIANAQERLERAQRHGHDKREASRQKIERLKAQYEEIALERHEKEKEQVSLKREIENTEQKISDFIALNQTEINNLLAENTELRHSVNVYMDTLATKLGLDFQSPIPRERTGKVKRRKKSKA